MTAVVGVLDEDRAPLILFAVFMILGIAGPGLGWLGRKRSMRKRKSIPAPARSAILAEFPELADLAMLVCGTKDRMRVDGSTLYIPTDLIVALCRGGSLSDEGRFILGHEARHRAVGASRLLMVFRTLRIAYAAAGGALFGLLLLNVAAVFDDPDRLSLTIAAIVVPYAAASLQSVLRRANEAFEWWFELDADRAGLARCLDENGIRVIRDIISRQAAVAPSEHAPKKLRIANLDGRPTYRIVGLTLFLGWLAAIFPLLMAIAFSIVTVNAPDQENELLVAVYIVPVFFAVATIFVSTWPVGWRESALIRTAAIVFLNVYAQTMRWFAWGIVLLAFSVLVKALGDLPYSDAWTVVGSAVLFVVASMVGGVYAKAALAARRGLGPALPRMYAFGGRRYRIGWFLGAAAFEAMRLWGLAWLLRATSVLPFFNDVAALGAAMQKYGGFVAVEVLRIATEESGWLLRAAVACVLWTSVLTMIAIFSAVRATHVPVSTSREAA
jgi:hypothetical protein